MRDGLQFLSMNDRDKPHLQTVDSGSPQTAADLTERVDELEYTLSLTPLERLIRHDQALELILAMRQAGIRHYGFDPGLPEDSDGS